MNESTFNYIFKLIHDSGKYSFNKSHAISYATLCYETAYYKYYHTKEFIACSLTNIYINTNNNYCNFLAFIDKYISSSSV